MRNKILTILEKNARISAHDMAILLGEPEEAVAAEIAAMEKEKVIGGYHTLINWEKAGNDKVTALIEVKVTPQRGMGFDSIAEQIYHYPEVQAIYLMSGAFDFTVILEGRTMREVAQFVADKLSPMEAVLSTATHFVLKKYKDHGTVLAEEVRDERMLIMP
ncbi:Lrp/AsnC family transcriptional regulator [Hominifimenecus sp. rT4P-3]|uniref:Lrp/AsnC family transcriptional regulator n=1 Tax=Hominifimenecus sp. rT4P-3 TaxID=3242979 RepID=UPI003DA53D24